MSERVWGYLKWFANGCFILATISLLSPKVASNSLFPWIAYLLGNGSWAADSIHHKNVQWIWIAGFFSIWDVLLIYTRLFGTDVFSILSPLVHILEYLP